MATFEEALLPVDEAEPFKRIIGQRREFAKNYWLPLHLRMDRWSAMYFLLDEIQKTKPIGFRRFISNEPRTAVDSAVSILTRNDSFWRIDLNQIESENKEERKLIGKVERTLQGIVNDLDEMFSSRFEMPLWKQVSFQSLLRGWIWGKFHVTTTSLAYRNSPMEAEIYDARTVYPHFDQYGLNYVIIEKLTTVGDLATLYPEVFEDQLRKGENYNPNLPAVKLEYWSNTRGERMGLSATLAVIDESPGNSRTGQIIAVPYITDATLSRGRWLIPPHFHGYTPESLPVVGVPVNGVALKLKPAISDTVINQFEQQANLFNIQERAWQGPNTWVAESGRSILSAVEEQVPQFNELVATIFQHFSMGAFPTWIFKTPTATLPHFTEGLNAKIPMRPEETVERMDSAPISQDAFRLLEILRDEQQKGTLSSILRASIPGGGASDLNSGILFQQITNAALNALEPFHDGGEQFGMRMGTSILGQLQQSAELLDPFTVAVRGTGATQSSFFSIEFSPQEDLVQGRKYRARPVFKPALPDDMAIRMQTARLALDPRRPLLSLVTVLERILQVEDPAGEIDRIWEDMANSDPIIVMEQIAMALEKMGEDELAGRMRESQMRAKLLEDLQFRQQTGGIPGLNGGEPPGLGPETGAAEATRQTSSPEEQERQAMAAEGGQLVGAIGERTNP